MKIEAPTRRGLLRVAALAAAWLAARPRPALAGGEPLAETPACADSDEPTPKQTEGPFFKPQSPERASLVEPGDTAGRLRLTGRVLSVRCKPLAGALLDFWHADARGRYDLEGFRYRGHLFADAEGRFELSTIVPGLYTGRTRHIHVRVQAPHGAILTTQLYFPGEPRNKEDFLFMPALLLKTAKSGGALDARFDFVLRA